MRLALFFIVSLILIIGVTYCQVSLQERALKDYATKFELVVTGKSETHFFTYGPFFYKDKHQQIWSIPVTAKDGRSGVLWARFAMFDDVYLVIDGKETRLK